MRMQLVFTTHEDTIMDQSLFRRDEIWFVERDADNASKIYFLDRFKERAWNSSSEPGNRTMSNAAAYSGCIFCYWDTSESVH